MGIARTIRNNLATIVAGCAVAALVAWSFAFFWGGGAAAAWQAPLIAVIHDGDGGVRRMPLAEDGELVISTSAGTNTVRVSGGEARIVEADCPKRECMSQVAISRPGQQLICLPHRLWVEIVAPDSGGTGMNVDSVTWADGPGEPGDGIDVVSR